MKWTTSDIVIAVCAGICVALGVVVAPAASGSVWIPVLIGIALIVMLVRARRQRSRHAR
jgi:Flp pilus assembly protein TadB